MLTHYLFLFFFLRAEEKLRCHFSPVFQWQSGGTQERHAPPAELLVIQAR